MKRNYVLLCLFILALNSYGQSIPYPKLQSIFDSWKNSRASAVGGATTQLKAISAKWKLQSTKPSIDGDTKYYLWKAAETASDSSYLALYIEEDDTTVQYSLKYIFNSASLYNAYTNSLKASNPDRISSFTDNSKKEFTLTAEKARIDYFLKSFPGSGAMKAYSMDIVTKYITK